MYSNFRYFSKYYNYDVKTNCYTTFLVCQLQKNHFIYIYRYISNIDVNLCYLCYNLKSTEKPINRKRSGLKLREIVY